MRSRQSGARDNWPGSGSIWRSIDLKRPPGRPGQATACGPARPMSAVQAARHGCYPVRLLPLHDSAAQPEGCDKASLVRGGRCPLRHTLPGGVRSSPDTCKNGCGMECAEWVVIPTAGGPGNAPMDPNPLAMVTGARNMPEHPLVGIGFRPVSRPGPSAVAHRDC